MCASPDKTGDEYKNEKVEDLLTTQTASAPPFTKEEKEAAIEVF